MNTLLAKLDGLVVKPLKDWVKKVWGRNDDDNDPFGNNPYVIL